MNRSLLKKVLVIFASSGLLAVEACKKDDGISCTTCSSADTSDFQLCEEANGNASVNGQDTGTPYEAYISDLREVGVACGK